MAHEEALKLAGFEVHAFAEFGSYQGDFLAKITYKGRDGYIHDYFGSCSFCDALEAELEASNAHCQKHKYIHFDCDECRQAREVVLAKFSERYYDQILTKEQALKKARENIKWDLEAQKMVDWLNAN